MTVLDLFAGPGGWDVAARDLGINPIGFEIDAAANQTRRAAGLQTVDTDVTAVDPQEEFYAWPVEGLLASPPCQAFSTAGKQKGKQDIPAIRRAAIQLCHGRDHRADYEWQDARSPLVLEPLRWALGLQPEWTCWEQVPPVLPFWELCGKLLEQRGYHVWTGMLHAETFGVPQTRKRAFLIASRVGPVGPPAPTHSRYYPRDKARLDEGVEKWVSMAEALGWSDAEGYLRSNYGTGGVAEIRGERRLDQPAPTMTSKAGRNRWCYERPATTVLCTRRSRDGILVGRQLPRGEGENVGGKGYHDGPKGSGDAVRVTVEQAAVLQSFPADYPWQGTRTKQFEQVGNAVPPGLARPVIEAALAAGALELAA